MCLADVALIEPTMLSCRGLAGAATLWPTKLMVRLPLLAKISIDYSTHSLNAMNFCECMLAYGDHQIPIVCLDSLPSVTILGQRRKAIGHGHTLAAGLLAVNPILGLYYNYRHKGSLIEGGMIIPNGCWPDAGSTLLDPYRIKLHTKEHRSRMYEARVTT